MSRTIVQNPTKNLRRKGAVPTTKATMREETMYLRVVDVSISCVLQRRSTKRSDREWRRTNTDFSARAAMKIILATYSVNFVNRSTRPTGKTKTTISGSAAIVAIDGYGVNLA
jgi:hypothetical protein